MLVKLAQQGKTIFCHQPLLRMALKRPFAVRSIASGRKEYHDTTYSEFTERKHYLHPEPQKEKAAKRKEAKAKEDFKNKLLEARRVVQEAKVETDYVFGEDIPTLLSLSKSTAKEMYFSDKSYDFDYLLALYHLPLMS